MAAGKSKSGSMFDPEALMEAHKRNFQALADAGNIVAEGMRSYAERQVAMAREFDEPAVERAAVGGQARARGSDRSAGADAQRPSRRSWRRSRSSASTCWTCRPRPWPCSTNAPRETSRPWARRRPSSPSCSRRRSSAFEQASQQTSVVIDEMKRRVASLEDVAKAEGATRCAQAGGGAAPPAEPPPAPKAPAAKRPTRSTGAKPKAN